MISKDNTRIQVTISKKLHKKLLLEADSKKTTVSKLVKELLENEHK